MEDDNKPTSAGTTGTGNDTSGEDNNCKVTTNKRTQAMAAAILPQTDAEAPAAKKSKFVSAKDIEYPSLRTFRNLWVEGPMPDPDVLQTGNALFGTKNSWFVRESYIKLLDDILQDTDNKIQIVHGTAGIGKSSFLLFVLAWMRTFQADKNVLLHIHRNKHEDAAAVFFPTADNTGSASTPQVIYKSDPNYHAIFDEWYDHINREKSIFLVDGIVSFNGVPEHTELKYIVAKSPSCPIGWMDKSQNRIDRWLSIWKERELLSYAAETDIEQDVVKENMQYLGGVARYAFKEAAAEKAADQAISVAGATELFKLVETGLQSKFDNLKVVDRLIHRIPPEDGTGASAKFRFASEYVATKVSMALAISNKVETQELLRLFQNVEAAGGMRGVLFEAYAARRMSEGGEFAVKPLKTAEKEDEDKRAEGKLEPEKAKISS